MKQWALVLLLFVMFVRGMPEFLGAASANASLTLETTYTSVANGWAKMVTIGQSRSTTPSKW